MFNKKVKVKFYIQNKGGYTSSETDELNASKCLEHIKELTSKHGNIVIENVDTENNIINLTTQDSLEFSRVDQKMAEVLNVIRDYIIEK